MSCGRCGCGFKRSKSRRREGFPYVPVLAILGLVAMWGVPFAMCVYYNLFPAFDYEDIRGHVEVYGTFIAGVDSTRRILYVEPADTYTVVYALKPPVRGFYTILATGKESDAYAYVQDRLCGVSDVIVGEDEVVVKVHKLSRECSLAVTVQLEVRAGLAREFIGRAIPAVIGEYTIRDVLAVVELQSNASTKTATGIALEPVHVKYNSSQILLANTVPLIFLAVVTPILIAIWRLRLELEEVFTWEWDQ